MKRQKMCPICNVRPGDDHRGWCSVCLSGGPTYVASDGETVLPHVRDHEAMDWAEWAAARARAATKKGSR